jgi:hypothetical protein
VESSREELIAMANVDVDTEQEHGLAEPAGKKLAEQAGKRLAATAYEAVEERRKRVRRRAKRKGRKLERRLAKVAKKLPVDTPVDKRRRGRTAGRAAWAVRLVLAGAVVAAIYFAWRARNRREGTAEAGPAPDAFGAAVEASDDGEQASTTTITEG